MNVSISTQHDQLIYNFMISGKRQKPTFFRRHLEKESSDDTSHPGIGPPSSLPLMVKDPVHELIIVPILLPSEPTQVSPKE